MKQKKWLAYYSDTIVTGNEDSCNAVVTLWTKKEKVIKHLNENNYCYLGQLYSKEYGLQILFRNLLANPTIRNLIVVGIDLNESSKPLINLFEKGVTYDNTIIDTNIQLDDLVKEKHIKLIQSRVDLHVLDVKNDFKKVNDYLKKLKNKKGKGKKILLPLPRMRPPTRYPTDFSGFKARGRNLEEAQRNLYKIILRFGEFKPDKKRLEAANITVHIKNFTKSEKNLLQKATKSETPKEKVTNTLNNEKIITLQIKKLNCWDELRSLLSNYINKTNITLQIGTAYLHENDLESALETQEKKIKLRNPDPHGNLIIRNEEDLTKIIHVDQNGKTLDEIQGKTKKELFNQISEELRVSLLEHALDIGAELQKAITARKNKVAYEQDKPLYIKNT